MAVQKVILGFILFVGIVYADRICKCTPDSSCWPSISVWNSFNSSVDGRLLKLDPIAKVCYKTSDTFDPAACAQVTENYSDFSYRESHPSAMLDITYEFLKNLTCPLPTSDSAICYQGQVSIYAVNATTAAHVQEAILFASLNNLRVVIKSSGHDFVGRSSAPNSLLIWTKYINTMSFSSTFAPSGCSSPSYTGPALTAQPGNYFHEVYTYTESLGYNVVGGAGPTVSAAGGFATGGGHGILTASYGLAVDNALQFEIITAQGDHIIVNECQNQSLFWALRGGGGGFGVTISVTYKAHPSVPVTAGVFPMLSTNKDSWISAMTYIAAQAPSWSDQGWAGYFQLFTPQEVNFILFAVDVTLENFTATFAPFQEYVATLPGLSISGSAQQYSNYYSAYAAALEPIGDSMVTYGYYGSRLIPRSSFINNPQGIAQALWDSDAALICFTAGGVVNRIDPDSVSVSPAWREAVWHALAATDWTPTTPYEDTLALRANLTARVQFLDAVAGPNPGAYYNEMDKDEPNWQQVTWGSHYDQLLQLKQIWDPTDLFLGHHYVGSENWDLDSNCRIA